MNIPLSKVVWGVLIIVAAYLIYFFVWAGKDQQDLATTWNNYVFRSGEDSASQKAIETEPDPSDAWVR